MQDEPIIVGRDPVPGCGLPKIPPLPAWVLGDLSPVGGEPGIMLWSCPHPPAADFQAQDRTVRKRIGVGLVGIDELSDRLARELATQSPGESPRGEVQVESCGVTVLPGYRKQVDGSFADPYGGRYTEVVKQHSGGKVFAEHYGGNPCGEITLPHTDLVQPSFQVAMMNSLRVRHGLPPYTPEECRAMEADLQRQAVVVNNYNACRHGDAVVIFTQAAQLAANAGRVFLTRRELETLLGLLDEPRILFVAEESHSGTPVYAGLEDLFRDKALGKSGDSSSTEVEARQSGDPQGVKKPDPFEDVDYATPASDCPTCRGTGCHQYPPFSSGKPNFSDSVACGACGGSGRSGA